LSSDRIRLDLESKKFTTRSTIPFDEEGFIESSRKDEIFNGKIKLLQTINLDKNKKDAGFDD
jgi:hypothetical protein